MTSCGDALPTAGRVYTSGPPGPDIPEDEVSSSPLVDVDWSVHAAAGPEGQLAQPMAYVEAPSSLPE